MSLTIFLGLVKKNFPPRLWPDAYSEARTAANRSGIDSLIYKKRKSDPFWCEQLKRRTDSKKVKKNQSSAPSQMQPADGSNREQQSQQNDEEEENPLASPNNDN